MSIQYYENLNIGEHCEIKGNFSHGISPNKSTAIFNSQIYENGDVYQFGESYSSRFGSDIRLKQNIKKINDSDHIEKMSKINFYEYEYKPEYKKIISDKNHINGILADELEKQFPDAVKYMDIGKLKNVKIINYEQLTLHLLKTVNELSTEITKLKHKIKN